jgi:hypothetical protein
MPAPDTLLQGLIAPSHGNPPAWRAILWGTLLAGTLDICAAMISVQLRGIPAIQAVKGVAAGWLGRDAFRGGEGVVALGFLSHYAIMAVIVALFYAASRSLPVLTKYWVWAGVAYGAAVYAVMSLIVVPLSAFPRSGAPSLANVLQNLAIMIVCVGLPIAYVARRFAAAALIAADAK